MTIKGRRKWIKYVHVYCQKKESNLLAKCRNNINTEEWYPTYEKDTHNHSNRNGRLVIGYMIWWWMMQMTHFKLLFWLSSNATVSIRLFFHNFTADTGPSYGPYRFYMLLCIAIQSEIFAFLILFRVWHEHTVSVILYI